jgi:hypothetical protein
MFIRAQLPEVHLEILKLLWAEWNSTRAGDRIVDGGLTRDEIFTGLSGKVQSNWRPKPAAAAESASPILPSAPPLVNVAPTLKRHLHQLCNDAPKYLTSGKVTDRRGSPFVYKINDLTVATWPSTAFLLTDVWKAKHREKRLLIEAMLNQEQVAFLDKSATSDQIIREIEKEINWCLAHSYLEYVEEHEETAYRPAARLHYEYRLLEFIARQARP